MKYRKNSSDYQKKKVAKTPLMQKPQPIRPKRESVNLLILVYPILVKKAIVLIKNLQKPVNLIHRKRSPFPTRREGKAVEVRRQRAKRSTDGPYVVVEAVGGRKNPNVIPVMILEFTPDKWDKMIDSGKTFGEVLYETDVEMKQQMIKYFIYQKIKKKQHEYQRE